MTSKIFRMGQKLLRHLFYLREPAASTGDLPVNAAKDMLAVSNRAIPDMLCYPCSRPTLWNKTHRRPKQVQQTICNFNEKLINYFLIISYDRTY